jgi:hypothetical protein
MNALKAFSVLIANESGRNIAKQTDSLLSNIRLKVSLRINMLGRV